MKAILWTRYGPPEALQLVERDTPKFSSTEVLIKIVASNIFTGDTEMRQFKMHPSLWLPIRLFMGLFRPRIPVLGQEFSGIVVDKGSEVDEFQPGDEIFGSTGTRFGSYAEYIALPGSYPMIHKPEKLSHRDASTVTVGGQHALHFLRLAKLQAGEHILIFGACGCIGTYAIQLAKLWGAEVTAVDSADKLAVLAECGADHLIDYRQQDFTQTDNNYDVIFDVVGHSPYEASLARLNAGGRYILANVGLSSMLRAAWTNRSSNKKIITKLAKVTRDDLKVFSQLMADGNIKAIVDRTYPLQQAADAHRYIDEGNKKGHVVLQIQDQ
ncbi:MAG: NAD(P)-dependent alcohol dehydrogenase [Gammaproteobacteria bacterium]